MKSPAFEWWLGTGYGPYDNIGLVGKSYCRLSQPLYLNLFARIGTSEGITEGALGVGLRYRY